MYHVCCITIPKMNMSYIMCRYFFYYLAQPCILFTHYVYTYIMSVSKTILNKFNAFNRNKTLLASIVPTLIYYYRQYVKDCLYSYAVHNFTF